MSRWFRFYTNSMRNPKVARLTDKQHRLWTNLMCVAADNDGHIPALEDLKYALNRRLDHLSTGVKELISAGLIDALADGYEPHNWSKHQYKSDVSTDRVQKYREKRNVSETPPEADTETETEKNTPLAPKRGRERVVKNRVAENAAVVPEWVPAEPWAGFLEMRAKMKKTPTSRAIQNIVGKLEKFQAEGHSPSAVLDQSTNHNWIDIYPIKDNANGTQTQFTDAGRAIGRTEAAARNVAARIQSSERHVEPAGNFPLLDVVRPYRDVANGSRGMAHDSDGDAW